MSDVIEKISTIAARCADIREKLDNQSIDWPREMTGKVVWAHGAARLMARVPDTTKATRVTITEATLDPKNTLAV